MSDGTWSDDTSDGTGPASSSVGPLPDGFDLVGSETVFRSSFTTIRRDRIRMPDGDVTEREIAEHLSAVGAVPLDADDRVVLVRQYRHAFGRHYLEIPAGKLDVDGEDPAAAMRRELAEEVELAAADLETLVTFTNSAGWTTEQTTVYLATGLSAEPRPDDFDLTHEEADMEVVRIPLDEAVAMVHAGEIVDSKTVIGLLAVADRRRR
ncbi:NUDIX domain-containing protein [Euzebya sp.]|uniref:NUDIX domain-containing protein n=1 Tax=Euzebya sp. TaxID=1971409 RepID=UPI0035151BDE